MREHVWNLRSNQAWRVIASALWDGARRDGFRVVHFAIMGNHIHMLVEAENRQRLSRGLQGLGVSVARRLNRLMRSCGPVMWDRYHARILKTPTHVRNARAYLLRNAYKHYKQVGPDRPFTSEWPLVPPQTWLMRLVC
jgi:REP element-mobilizing transposase RayT